MTRIGPDNTKLKLLSATIAEHNVLKPIQSPIGHGLINITFPLMNGNISINITVISKFFTAESFKRKMRSEALQRFSGKQTARKITPNKSSNLFLFFQQSSVFKQKAKNNSALWPSFPT